MGAAPAGVGEAEQIFSSIFCLVCYYNIECFGRAKYLYVRCERGTFQGGVVFLLLLSALSVQ